MNGGIGSTDPLIVTCPHYFTEPISAVAISTREMRGMYDNNHSLDIWDPPLVEDAESGRPPNFFKVCLKHTGWIIYNIITLIWKCLLPCIS